MDAQKKHVAQKWWCNIIQIYHAIPTYIQGIKISLNLPALWKIKSTRFQIFFFLTQTWLCHFQVLLKSPSWMGPLTKKPFEHSGLHARFNLGLCENINQIQHKRHWSQKRPMSPSKQKVNLNYKNKKYKNSADHIMYWKIFKTHGWYYNKAHITKQGRLHTHEESKPRLIWATTSWTGILMAK